MIGVVKNAGVEQSIEQIFSELHPGLLRAAQRWAPAESVDDVVQETWIGVMKGIDCFEGRSQLSTWVFGILWRQCSRQWRNIGAKPTVHLSGREFPSEAPEDNPHRVVEGYVDSSRILSAIDALPQRYRQVVILRDVLGKSASETCEIMELSEANQRVLLHRARGRVRLSLPDLALN